MFADPLEPAASESTSGEPERRDAIFLTPAEPPSLHVELAPAPTSAPEPLLRADDALTGVGLRALVDAPDFVPRYVERERTGPMQVPLAAGAAEAATAASAGGTHATETHGAGDNGRVIGGGETRARAAFDDRGSFARRLESELSAAERRLFPDSPSTASASADEYEDALGDIDLDALGIDTIPGIGGDALDRAFDLRPRNGHAERLGERGGDPVIANVPERRPNGKTEPYATRGADPAAPRVEERVERSRPRTTLPDEEGDLASDDVTVLFARLHAGAFSGALSLTRNDGEKLVFFDDGAPIGARSSFAHDRLADLLLREGSIVREAYQRLRDLPDGGRRAALQLVERGLVKSSELFATLRHHVEEILFSCFAWERGRYRLGREQAPAEDRVRLGAHPLAFILEGVRRKYSLERLVERVGPPETVLTPTTALLRTLDDCALTPGERAVAELIDGERSLAELSLGVVGARVPEASVYAVAWVLLAAGAVRIDSDEPAAGAGAGVRAMATLVAPAGSSAATPERRTRPRPVERARDRESDRAVDRDRVLAKRAQVQDGDYFAVLGLGRDASAHEVARAFERLKREFDPDRFVSPLREELAPALTEIGEVLDEAHRVLADDGMRRSYRAHLPAS
jgi:hypothetical protein